MININSIKQILTDNYHKIAYISWLFAVYLLLLPLCFNLFLGSNLKFISRDIREITAVNAENSLINGTVQGISTFDDKNIFLSIKDIESQEDIRAIVLSKYLSGYKCSNGQDNPLENQSVFLVKYADKYGIDWKLSTAVAGVETWFGCTGKGSEYFNAWGIGGGPSTRIKYSSWEEGIEAFSKMMAEGYGKNVHTRIYDIASFYVTGKEGQHDGWADGVTKYMNGISHEEKHILDTMN